MLFGPSSPLVPKFLDSLSMRLDSRVDWGRNSVAWSSTPPLASAPIDSKSKVCGLIDCAGGTEGLACGRASVASCILGAGIGLSASKAIPFSGSKFIALWNSSALVASIKKGFSSSAIFCGVSISNIALSSMVTSLFNLAKTIFLFGM